MTLHCKWCALASRGLMKIVILCPKTATTSRNFRNFWIKIFCVRNFTIFFSFWIWRKTWSLTCMLKSFFGWFDEKYVKLSYLFLQDLNHISIMESKMTLFFTIFLVFPPLMFCSILTKNEDHHVVYSVVSGSAHLPCNITPPLGTKGKQQHKIYLKIFFKQEKKFFVCFANWQDWELTESNWEFVNNFSNM